MVYRVSHLIESKFLITTSIQAQMVSKHHILKYSCTLNASVTMRGHEYFLYFFYLIASLVDLDVHICVDSMKLH